MFGLLGAYWTFDLGAASSVASTPDSPQPKTEPELLPPVGKGQRFSREYVRYCHFQEERLRVVKQQVRGPEVIAKRKLLEADAERILSTWPWHKSAGGAPAASSR